MLKQYTLKPLSVMPESPQEPTTAPSRTTPKAKPPKPQPPVEDMTKKELVSGLQWEHPTRTLDVGTINANASRALSKEFLSPAPTMFLPLIKHSLREVARLAARSKRTCQRAIGQYLERLSLREVDEVDKIILSKLCPPFSDKDIATDKGDPEEDSTEYDNPPDDNEHDDTNDNKNDPLLFFMSLLTAIYSSKPPPSTGKTGPAVRMFLDRAKEFLPARTMTGGPQLFFLFTVMIGNCCRNN